jgi:hypothetical protein
MLAGEGGLMAGASCPKLASERSGFDQVPMEPGSDGQNWIHNGASDSY